jgi:membrane fusion protein (multidrug efflux system)
MSTAFTRTLRSLDADRFVRPGVAIGAIAAFLAAWGGWAMLSHVTLREVSNAARIEVAQSTYPVQAPMAGRVVKTYLAVGRTVKAGEPLVELDAAPEKLQYQEERTRAQTLLPAIEALKLQLEAETQARTREQEATRTAIEQARANTRTAEAPARYNELEEKRLSELRKEGLIAEREYQRGHADAEQARAVTDRENFTVSRLAEEQRTKESDRDSRMRGFEAEIAKLEGQIATSKAAMQRLQNEMERRIIRAPIAGRLGEAQSLRVGAVVDEGERLAAIVPEGQLLVVAQFAPASAMGRLAEGQSAEVRLQGFPWAQWGTAPALVSRVASEIRDGTVRVELKIDPSRPCRIPLRHGMPGAVEVSVERVTPATLLLRLAGRMLASPRNPYTPGQS